MSYELPEGITLTGSDNSNERRISRLVTIHSKSTHWGDPVTLRQDDSGWDLSWSAGGTQSGATDLEIAAAMKNMFAVAESIISGELELEIVVDEDAPGCQRVDVKEASAGLRM